MEDSGGNFQRQLLFYNKLVLQPPIEPGVYTSIAFTDQLVDEVIAPSVGDANDNSLVES